MEEAGEREREREISPARSLKNNITTNKGLRNSISHKQKV